MKIAHLADIHWRLKDRHEEYKAVMQKLYAQLVDDKPDVIVLAGDLVHSKIAMSPELVMEVREFLTELVNIAPVRIIPGNHDLNLSNVDRMDAITPCLPTGPMFYDIEYYTESGLYEDKGNIVWGVWSCIDNKHVELKDKDPNCTYIALFHGPIVGAKLDNNYKLENVNTSISMFKQFDMVFLGDIHKYQTFRKDNTIAYCGSLIQQNYGESLGKGYLLWDTDTKTHVFKEVQNDYGFYTIDASNGKLPNVVLPSKCRIRVIWPAKSKDLSKAKIAALTARVHKKYNPLSVQFSFKPVEDNLTPKLNTDELDPRNSAVQENILSEWIDHREGLDKKAILDIDRDIREQVQSTAEDFSNCVWQLNKVSITNFMSYAGPVEIDFNNLNGVVGLFGQNAVGKSVIIDAILYALFNKITRSVKNEELVNKITDSLTCSVMVELSIKGFDYQITRSTTKLFKKATNTFTGSKTQLNISRKIGDGEWEIQNGEGRVESEKIIRNAIGTFDDFLTVTLSTPSAGSEFVSQTPAIRSDNIIRFLGLNVFLQKHDLGKKLLNDVEWSRKQFDITIETTKLAAADNRKNTLVSEALPVLEKSLLGIKAQLQKFVSLKTKLAESLNRESSALESEDSVKNSILLIDTNLEKSINELDRVNKQYSSLKIKVKALDDDFSASEEQLVELTEKKHRLAKVEKDLATVSNELNIAKVELKAKEDFLKTTTCPVEDDDRHLTCQFLAGVKPATDRCNVLKSIIVDKESKQALLCNEQTKLFNVVGVLADQELVADAITTAAHKLTQYQTKIRELESSIQNLRLQKQLKVNTLESIHQNKTTIEKNAKIRSGISDVDAKILELESIEKTKTTDIQSIKFEIKQLNVEIESVMAKIEELNELEARYKALYAYCSAMHRDGIPTLLLRQYIDIINYKINLVLSDVVSFGVYFDMPEDSTDIKIHMRYDGEVDDTRPAKLASGMERLMINFAIRYALISIGKLSKPSSWFVDEGFGVCTTENLDKIDRLFQNMKETFKNIIMITHIDSLKDIADHSITISKINGLSHLTLS